MHSTASTVFEPLASLTAVTQRWKRITTPAALLEGLVAGAWSVAAEFEGNGCLYLVVRGNDPEARVARALTPLERQMLERVALGQSNKFVSYELGTSQSCVSAYLNSARLKLGVRSRTELVQLMQFGTLPSIEPRAEDFSVRPGENVVLRVVREQGATPAVLTSSERFIFRAILDGLSNAEIATRRGRSLRTVANQVASVFHKLAISSRAELVAQHRDFAAVFQQEIDPAPTPYLPQWAADRCVLRPDVRDNQQADQRGPRAVMTADSGSSLSSATACG
jgi:DNA-binding NarL/FixJ family response regulator